MQSVDRNSASRLGQPSRVPRWVVLMLLWGGLGLLTAAGLDWLAYSGFVLITTGAG